MNKLLLGIPSAMLLPFATAAHATERTATPSTLSSIVTASVPGDSISFAPGKWGNVALSGKTGLLLKFQPGAVLNRLSLSSSTNIQLKGLVAVLAFQPGSTTRSTTVVLIDKSKQIDIDTCRVKGAIATTGVPQTATTLDSTGNVIGLASGYPFQISNSDGVRITHCDISTGYKGVFFNSSRNLTFEDLDVHDNRTSPIAGSVYQDLAVRRVHAWCSKTWGYGGSYDHGDGFAVWTWAAENQDTKRVTYEDNLYEAKTCRDLIGFYAMAHDGSWGHQDLIVRRNTVITNHEMGYYIERAKSGSVQDNIALANDPIPTNTIKHPYVYLTDVNAQVVSGNRASMIYWNQKPAGWTDRMKATNTLAPTKPGQAAAAVSAWMVKFRPRPLAIP